MIHRSSKLIGAVAVLAAVAAARGSASASGGDFQSQVAIKAALTLARAADADKSGDVTSAEWSAFIASLHPDASGVISPDALIAALQLPPQQGGTTGGGTAFSDFVTLLYDRDGDGKIETYDLASLFAMLDTNHDGALSVVELAAAQGGLTSDQDVKSLALLLAHAADADKSGDVSAMEWANFVVSLHPDANGVIDPNALITALSLMPPGMKSWHHDDEGDDEQGDDNDQGDEEHASSSPPAPAPTPSAPADLVLLVTRLFDRDFDGLIGTDDLNALFALIDTNHDGALSAAEIAAASPTPTPPVDEGKILATFLARAADADKSGDVTAAEWANFKASLHPDANGVVDFVLLVAAFPTTLNPDESDPVAFVQHLVKVLDRNGDGKVTTSDLDALFALLDTNGDGAISAAEMAAGGTDEAAQDARRIATLLARAADADKSGDVTATEWTNFIASLHPDATGVIDFVALIAVLPTDMQKSAKASPTDLVQRVFAALDQDHDGKITVTDLNTLFAVLDTNGDGALSATELLPPKALRMMRAPALGILARAADANHDRRVTSAEVSAFLDGLVVDRATGAVDLTDLASKLPPAPGAPADPARREAQLAKLFDVDRDGVVTLSDLRTIFAALDLNHDGTITMAELRRARRHAK
jgi:Ca2+-binding EF-hand superfamily protein